MKVTDDRELLSVGSRHPFTGTVTDVTKNNRVLGFGHAMFGRGNIALPMATGYVHFIVPSRSISFKTTAGLDLRGSLVQDEATGVAGVGGDRYETSPVNVTVKMPGMKARDYSYRVVDHPMLTPSLTPTVAQRSITAVRSLPRKNTVRLEADLRFSQDRRIEIDSTLSEASATGVLTEMVPAISMMMENQHQPLSLTKADVRVRVQRGIEQATIANARLDEVVVEPGQTITATVRIQPYGKALQRREIEFTVPEDVSVGDYQLVISDASGYLSRYLKNHPHLMNTTSIAELQSMIEKVLSIKRDAIYFTLQLKKKGIAVGRDEMPSLPSSRRTMLTSPTSTAAIAITTANVPVRVTDTP